LELDFAPTAGFSRSPPVPGLIGKGSKGRKAKFKQTHYPNFIHAFRSDAPASRKRAGGAAHRCTDFGRRLRGQRKVRGDPPCLPRRRRRFSTWCEAVGAIALPATPATVAAYLAALADLRLEVSTIPRRSAAIAYAHKLAGFEPPSNETVKAVLRGVRRELGTAQKGKAPATAAVVAKLVQRIPDDLSGKRDKALILIGFAARVAPQRARRAHTRRRRARARRNRDPHPPVEDRPGRARRSDRRAERAQAQARRSA
jgi:hypothetical protein